MDTPKPGDTLVIEKAGGLFNVSKMNSESVWERLRHDLPEARMAWEIARTSLEPEGRTIWRRREAEPDSAIEKW